MHRVRGEPEQPAINYAVLRSMKQAEYSPVDEGHYALAEEDYCHFTSPIRRYPDLLVHRLIDGIVTKRKSHHGPAPADLIRLGRHCSSTERRAEKAERTLTSIKLLTYLESRIGMELKAVITGVDRIGFFCRGIELPAEGLVHISSLPSGDQYDADRATMTITARRSGEKFRLGDLVEVKVAHVDVDRRELSFHFLRHLSSAKRKSSPKKETGTKGQKQGAGARAETFKRIEDSVQVVNEVVSRSPGTQAAVIGRPHYLRCCHSCGPCHPPAGSSRGDRRGSDAPARDASPQSFVLWRTGYGPAGGQDADGHT